MSDIIMLVIEHTITVRPFLCPRTKALCPRITFRVKTNRTLYH